MPWFAVRTFIRERVVGRPRSRSSDYLPGVVAVEERVVLFRTRDAGEALRRGEREARAYARFHRCVNIFGQRVVCEVLPFVESYEVDLWRNRSPGEGDEVFSSIELCPAKEPPARIIARKVGTRGPPEGAEMFGDGLLLTQCSADLAEAAARKSRKGRRRRARRNAGHRRRAGWTTA